MNEPSDTAASFGDDSIDEGADVGRTVPPIIAIIVATAVFYLGREILLPLTAASLLAVIFSPVANRMERIVGRFASAALIVLATIVAVGAIGYFLTVQLANVAVDVAGYSSSIADKLKAIQRNTPEWLQSVEDGVADVEQQLQRANTKEKARKPPVVQTLPTSSSISEIVKPILPIVASAAESLLVIVLVFFLLYSRRDFRDRFVKLASRARITVTSQAIETAVDAVSRYLLLFSLNNLAFGLAIGITVWLIGLPNPVFWGTLAFLLRFIPYVGALIAGVLPALVAFAVFTGWSKSIEVLAAFIILDQVAAHLIEPFFIGHGVGLSPLALLVSAMYWAWLWGPIGLLLATPLTSCLKVAGDYIPSLGFLAILLGRENAFEGYHEYYRRLLEFDQTGARSLAVRYSDENGLEPTFNDIIIPALNLMGTERGRDHISPDNERFIVDATRELIVELGKRCRKSHGTPKLRILGICPPPEVHSLGLLILLELLRQDGAAATFLGEHKTADEVCEHLRRFSPDIVCMSCTTVECLPAAVELSRRLRSEWPLLMIIVGGRAVLSNVSEFYAAGCSYICASKKDTRRIIRRYILQRRYRIGM
jgi:predicted PurR-regulated permease PerM/methanogenic corrinoid protein MtbC1